MNLLPLLQTGDDERRLSTDEQPVVEAGIYNVIANHGTDWLERFAA